VYFVYLEDITLFMNIFKEGLYVYSLRVGGEFGGYGLLKSASPNLRVVVGYLKS